jgi:hypothetical protein
VLGASTLEEGFVNHTIRYQSPEKPSSISNLFAIDEASALAKLHHLEGLGYTIVEVSPPLARWATQGSLPQARMPVRLL